jgi:N utilization substance protein B
MHEFVGRTVTPLPQFDPDDEVNVEVVEHEEAATDRSLSRRIALQTLYEVDSSGHDPSGVIAFHLARQQVSRKAASYLRRLVNGVLEHKVSLDTVIQQYAPEWPLEQVAIVDRNILRMAVYEFILQSRTPVSVAIDEAVALANMFGSEGSPRFVNGVLGSLAEQAESVRQQLGIPQTAQLEKDEQ